MDKLYCGECVDIMSGFGSEIIDLTVTSPPYDNLRDYNGYTFDFEMIAQELYRITKKGGVVVWVVGDQTKDGDESGTSFRQALYFKENGFKLFDTMIYSKPPRGGFGNPRRYIQAFEYMFVFSKGKPKTANMIKDRENKWIEHRKKGVLLREKDGRRTRSKTKGIKQYGKRTNIWHYTTGLYKSTKDKIAYQHPAIFPEKLAEDHILSWSNEGDLVFDPMMGSGTTGKMAIKHNRRFIGVDISQEYVDIARERLKNSV